MTARRVLIHAAQAGIALVLAAIGATSDGGLDARATLAPGTEAPRRQRTPGAPAFAFVDVTASSGLDAWRSMYGDPFDKRTILENIGGGVALVDLDGDGRLDVYAATGQPAWGDRTRHNALVRGAPGNLFRPAPTSSGALLSGWFFGVATADFDDDGYRDLYITEHGRNVLLRNNGDGSFSDVTEATRAAFDGFSTGAAWADFDRDGNLDLLVNNYVVIDPDTAPPPGSGPHCRWKGAAVPCGPRGLPGERSRLLRGDGRGGFKPSHDDVFAPAEYYGLGAVWSDHDDDGWIDLYLADDQTPNRLYVNRSGRLVESGLLSGTAFSEDGHAQAGMGVDWAEIDEHGSESRGEATWAAAGRRPRDAAAAIADLIVTNFADETNALYRGLAPGLFFDDTVAAGLALPSFRQVGWGVGFRDFDNDDDLDLFVANGHVYSQVDTHGLVDDYAQLDQLFEHRGAEGFIEWRPPSDDGLAVSAVSRGAAFGDVDRDGRVDVLVGVLDGPVRLLANRSQAGAWLQIRLVGTAGNRDAVGARVVVEANGRRLRREVQAGHSYLSQSDLTLHFGLGNAASARVTVHWPSGSSVSPTVIESVSANRTVLVYQDGRIRWPGGGER